MRTIYLIIYGIGFLFLMWAFIKACKDVTKERNGELTDHHESKKGYHGF